MKNPGGGPSSWAQHVANMQRLAIAELELVFVKMRIRCRWCADHPGQTHRDRSGPLFDLLHHAGQYVTTDEADRISADGP